MTARAPATVTLTLPLPPASLSPNGRAHWAQKHADAQKWRVFTAGLIAGQRVIGWHDERNWPAAVMDIHWRYTYGRQPDDDNIIARCKACRDGAQDAGLVADDAQITTGRVTFERVPRGDEALVLTFRERSDDA